jgi:hypothetical protein
MEDEHGQRTGTLSQGKPCSFKMRVEFHRDVVDPIFGVTFEDDQKHPVFATNSVLNGSISGRYSIGDEVLLSVAFENAFRPGRYFANPAVAHRGGGQAWIDRREHMLTLMVTGTKDAGALVYLSHDLRIDHRPARLPEEVSG